MIHVPVGSGIRALHVRSGAPAMCARVASWLSNHGVHAVSCEDAFEAVANLVRNPETMPDIILVGLDWLNDDEFGLFAYLHETWPSAAILTYVQESLRREHAPRFTSIDCHSAEELDGVLANPPAAILAASHAARNESIEARPTTATPVARETPAIAQPPKLAPPPELPPLRAAPESTPADNNREQRRTPLRTITRPADLLTSEELAALLQKDFR